MMSEYYDKEGKPITLYKYGDLFEKCEYRRIGFTEVGEDTVSTVWLGIDYSFGNSLPLIFETMVFPDCDICERYSTLEQAKAGHERIVQELRNLEE